MINYSSLVKIPKDLMRSACSLVCPPLSNPVSNSPLVESTTKIVASACEAPFKYNLIMKILNLGDSKF